MPRNSRDTTLNPFGSALIDLCCTHDIHIFNGRLFVDVDGNFTCTANDGKSVVDYILGSASLFEWVSDFYISEEDFSDHFPVCCSLSFKMGYNNASDNIHVRDNANLRQSTSYKWNNDFKDSFMNTFSRLFTNFSRSVSELNVINKLPEFSSLYKQAGAKMRTRCNRSLSRDSPVQPDWWDAEC